MPNGLSRVAKLCKPRPSLPHWKRLAFKIIVTNDTTEVQENELLLVSRPAIGCRTPTVDVAMGVMIVGYKCQLIHNSSITSM